MYLWSLGFRERGMHLGINVTAHYFPSAPFCGDERCSCHTMTALEPVLQEFRLGLLTWSEVVHIASGRQLPSMALYYFVEVTTRAVVALRQAGIPYMLGRSNGVAVGFTDELKMVESLCGETPCMVYEDGGKQYRCPQDTGILDLVVDVLV